VVLTLKKGEEMQRSENLALEPVSLVIKKGRLRWCEC